MFAILSLFLIDIFDNKVDNYMFIITILILQINTCLTYFNIIFYTVFVAFCGHSDLRRYTMTWQEIYQSKLVTAEEAIKQIKNGDKVEVGLVMPISLCIDHKALDFGDTIPFFAKLDEIFANPEIIQTWK